MAIRAIDATSPPWPRRLDGVLLPHWLISTQVITGWDQGLLGAAVGEVRKLDIPAEEGYGKGGFPAWGIPPNGGLFFEIEVLSIKGKSAEL